jgi:hypothetical protein
MRDAFEEMLAEQRRKAYTFHHSNQKNRAA